jgi:fumarate reductase subunit C
VGSEESPAEEEVPQLGERDLSRRRDRQASWVLAAAAAVSMFIFFVLGLVVGLVAMAYSYVSGERTAFWVALVVVCLGLLTVIFGLTDFDGGIFQG